MDDIDANLFIRGCRDQVSKCISVGLCSISGASHCNRWFLTSNHWFLAIIIKIVVKIIIKVIGTTKSHWTPWAESIGLKVRLVFPLVLKPRPTNAAAAVAKHQIRLLLLSWNIELYLGLKVGEYCNWNWTGGQANISGGGWIGRGAASASASHPFSSISASTV